MPPLYALDEEHDQLWVGTAPALPIQMQSYGNKKVSFNDDVETILIRKSNKAASKKARWYYKEDYRKFKQDIADTMYCIEKIPEAIDEVHYTERGLERLISETSEQRQQKKETVRKAVFQEQEYQQKYGDGYNNHYWIAAVYRQVMDEFQRKHQNLTKGLEQDCMDVYMHDTIQNPQISSYRDRNIPYIDDNNQWNQQDQFFDEFNDSWITDIPYIIPFQSHGLDQSFDVGSGLNDSWITDVTMSIPTQTYS